MVGTQTLSYPTLLVQHMKLLLPSLVQSQGLTAGTDGDVEASSQGVVCPILSKHTIHRLIYLYIYTYENIKKKQKTELTL